MSQLSLKVFHHCYFFLGSIFFLILCIWSISSAHFQLSKWMTSRRGCWISGYGLQCGLLASQEIIKIITVACANTMQVLRHNTRWDRAPHTKGQGAAGCLGNPRLSCHYSFAHPPPFLICTMLSVTTPSLFMYTHNTCMRALTYEEPLTHKQAVRNIATWAQTHKHTPGL